MSIDTMRDPLIIQWWTDSLGNKKTVLRSNEPHKVINGKITLTEIPNEYDRVSITGYTEIRYGNVPSVSAEFVVNYTLGEITFYSTEEAKTITINQYYSRGVVYYPSTRIYNNVDASGNITQTLGDLLAFAKISYKTPVASYSNIATTYPSPLVGDAVQCVDTGKFYRYDGTTWQYFQILTPTQLATVLTNMGDITTLATINKTSVVNAINENVTNINNLSTEEMESTGYGVVSGLTVNAQTTPNMTVNVATGIVHMPNGVRFAPIANTALTINTSDTVKPRTDIVYVNSTGIITYLAGALGTAAVAGSETYTITTNAVATDTVVINGVTFTAIASGATGNQFNVGADTTITATNLTTTLNANATINALYTATSNTNIITLTEKVAGGGNTPTVSTKTGTIVITNGTVVTSTPPISTAPSLPSGGLLLSQIAVAKNVTTIVTANITDKRIMKVSLPLHLADDIKHKVSVNDYNASGSIQQTTGSITAGSAILTLASALDFKNNQGISVNHAGVACALITPTAPTVTPTGTVGTTTYQYQIVALDNNGGCTAAGVIGSTTTGNATLSTTNYNALSWSVVTNAIAYAIYGRVSGTIALLAIISGTTFNDIGSVAITAPSTLQSTPSTVSLADTLTTTIVSGAGTTSLTLAINATTTVVSQTVNHNDTVAIQNALNSLGVTGGTVYISASGKYFIDSLIIPEGVCLKGQLEIVGVPGTGNSVASNIWNYGSRIILKSTGTITLKGGASISNCFVVRFTMIAPENSAFAYAGTALTIAGDDTYVSKCLIVGFNQLLSSNGYQRIRCEDVQGDCINGFLVNNCYDISRFNECHLWPFGTIGSTTPITTFDNTHYLFRNGSAFKLTGVNDWTKITDCFCYGYYRGYDINDASSVNIIGCGADNISQGVSPYAVTGAIGFLIKNTNEVILTNCQTSAQQHGYYLTTISSPDNTVSFINCNAWHCNDTGIVIDGLDATIIGCTIRGVNPSPTQIGTGINIINANSDVTIANCTIRDLANGISGNNYATQVFSNNRFLHNITDMIAVVFPTVVAANPLPLKAVQRFSNITVSGNTNFSTIEATYPGHMVTLRFAGTPIVTSSATLKLSGSFVAKVDDTLTLVCDGTNWNEVARSGGSKIQTGSSSATVVTANTAVFVTITFPVAFATAPLVVASVTTLQTGNAGYVLLHVSATTATTCTIYVDSYIAQAVSFNWIAIGS